jgi:hypothetical protein
VREQVELTPGCCGEPGAEQRWCGDVGLWAEGGAWCPLVFIKVVCDFVRIWERRQVVFGYTFKLLQVSFLPPCFCFSPAALLFRLAHSKRKK